ncbi:hypothetical protein [Sphingobium sp. CCH11-B1]|jgi:hypothetical protein|uniref:hypothetical protein n=1 Tax=Sphingobium sp. CCH11-B1 TaxID=1768781 RepID=UPI000A82BE18|nr:hypothetical protein [Sphingobium sp. CCH11-B1]
MSEAIQINWDVCGRPKDYGPQVYDLRKLYGYDIMACKTCCSANDDGWGPFLEPIILKRLKEKGIEPPKRNAKGWLPLEFFRP